MTLTRKYERGASPTKPCPSKLEMTRHPGTRAEFSAKYKEEKLIAEGGHGAVFEGFRKVDNLPVAMKHIPQFAVERVTINNEKVPMEVALMLALNPNGAETSAAVTLLDWFDLKDDLILIQERPVPSVNLADHINSRPETMQENDAKVIMKQLVNALIEIHSKGVFHRDIKPDNILLEIGSNVPHVRIIDFGCGQFLTPFTYSTEKGTYANTCPDSCMAEPTTVWQLGLVLYEMLHKCFPFCSSIEITSRNPKVSQDLCFDCKDFLHGCLTMEPNGRLTLETLRDHPWLK